MRQFSGLVWLITVGILILSTGRVTSMKTNNDFVSNGISSHYLISSFGLSSQGSIDISYNIAPSSSLSLSSSMLLLIINEGQKNGYYKDSNSVYCNSPSLYRQIVYGSGNMTYQTTTGPDLYSILLVQCTSGNPDNPTKASYSINMYNPKPSSSSGVGWSDVSYLAIEEVTYVTVLEGLLIAYCILLLFLGLQIFYAARYTRTLHQLYVVALFLAIFNLIARYAEYVNDNSTGKEDNSFIYFSQFTGHFSTTMNLAVLLLLSLGWSILRIFLTDREKQTIVASLSIYFFLGILSASCIGDGTTCQALFLITYVMKNIVYLIIVVAMNLTVTQLRALLNHTPWLPSLTYQYTRTKQFQMFRILFIVYLLMPTLFLLLSALLFTWKESWMTPTLLDLLDLCLFYHVGVTFGPMNEWLLVRPFGSRHIGRDRNAAAAVPVVAGAGEGAVAGGAN